MKQIYDNIDEIYLNARLAENENISMWVRTLWPSFLKDRERMDTFLKQEGYFFDATDVFHIVVGDRVKRIKNKCMKGYAEDIISLPEPQRFIYEIYKNSIKLQRYINSHFEANHFCELKNNIYNLQGACYNYFNDWNDIFTRFHLLFLITKKVMANKALDSWAIKFNIYPILSSVINSEITTDILLDIYESFTKEKFLLLIDKKYEKAIEALRKLK